MSVYTAIGRLTPTPPFDFSKALDFLGDFAPTQGEQTTTSRALTKAVYVQGQVIVFQLTASGTVDEPQLAFVLFSEQPIDDGIREAAIDRITFYLGLDEDLRPFYEIGLSDPDFAPLVHDMYGYHQVKFLTPFEGACWAILTQRNPQNMARRMKQALTESYGGHISMGETTYWAFPEASRLAEAREDELLGVVHNARKAEYLVAVSRAFSQVDERFLREGDYEEVRSWLLSIKGFGEWSVSFVMVRGLGRTEHAPLSEKLLLEAASRVYGHGDTLSRADVAKIAERYGAYKGYWAHYLRVGS
jgi:DNA-3-methyladenine glycosylase II